MKKTAKPAKPSLVVIDTTQNLYTHYVGKQQTCQVKAESPMPADQLEEFRLNPLEVLGEDGDDVA